MDQEKAPLVVPLCRTCHVAITPGVNTHASWFARGNYWCVACKKEDYLRRSAHIVKTRYNQLKGQ